MAKAVKYRSLGTFEFLVDEAAFYFIANPRLQVEHTGHGRGVGVDLVKAQLLLAGGIEPGQGRLEGRGAGGPCDPAPGQHGTIPLTDRPSGRRHAPRSRSRPQDRACGHTYGYAGYRTNPNFDSLLAKVIVHSRRPTADAPPARAGPPRLPVEGAPSNIAFLRALLAHGVSAPTRSTRV